MNERKFQGIYAAKSEIEDIAERLRQKINTTDSPTIKAYLEGKASIYEIAENAISEKNASLINAAPDLLEACKAALSVLDGTAKDEVEPGTPSGAAMNLIATAIRKATVANSLAAAIEKATGHDS